MNIQVSPRKAQTSDQIKGVIDCDIHPVLKKAGDIKPYLSERWRNHFDTFGGHVRQTFASTDLYAKVAPNLARRDAYPPDGTPPGSDLAFMQQQHLDPHDIMFGVLQVLQPKGSDQRNLEYGAAMCSALNDWQLAEWTGPDPRLKASMVVTHDYPEAALAEVKRHRGNKDFVQLSMPQRSIEPLGRRRYWPIYAAAVENNLTIGIHTGGNNGYPPLAGGGWCSYYAEQHHLIALAMQAVVTSFVMEGVFEEFPTLRIVLIEGGFTWLPALMWRLDNLWSRLGAEVPHLKRPPSEYIRRNCWFSTQPMEEVKDPEELRRTFDWIGWDRLVFASDYPHWDYDDTRYAFPFKMSAEEKNMLFRDNAREAYALG